MKMIISKYERYPTEEPIGQAVGFTVYANERSFYIDTVISNEDIVDKTEEEILDLAWEELKEEILSNVEQLNSRLPLVGKAWNPPSEEVVEEELEEVRTDELDSLVSP